MKNLWCENCDHRWQGEEKVCPKCGEREDVRITMSESEAKARGLTD